MSWIQYVKATQELGFNKVCIVQRANYQTLASTPQDIATAWKDGDKQVNENQELLDDWTDNKKNAFCFFGTKFNVLSRFEEDAGYYALVCAKGNEVCLAAEFKTIWFVAKAVKKKASAPKEDPGFAGAPKAYTVICKNVWDALAEGGC
mmetsp:Transcript_60724/g.54706  ORF Transcript_60724/g.54706 Transcript_60724/m.54706 type:complete len:148 (+) Transcript_60724:141-584(+)|eukprot:CAMPEP_0201568124 /NCGR_PEP_ID=MMETSP0190_2-20130828/9009_1 /ASSEMBLY_ACC=CAM_ASM_000263 /TAXON_ID=37353 /ORGANISM="Rosalina sp." /LENGTH=147 /DNA_ID=CAMNT_0047988891 /DNA_START=132 /DNA_END=575 /DNA_ORIENTATION=+